jgi:hypothetical protein
MKTIFLSGSRKLSRLNEAARVRLQNMIDQEFHIIIGDANGADKALQQFFADQNYRNVTVYCSGDKCRNNVGQWETNNVAVDRSLKGRAFYTVKDREMAQTADIGMVLWDGKSEGSVNNMIEMTEQKKPVVVYVSPQKSFVNIKTTDDTKALIGSYQFTSKRNSIADQPQLALNM